jgi:sulfate adenylyltransferase subunit 2
MQAHLQQLEAQAIYILREVIAEFEKPVLMYSIGKDSAVLLHLLRKACAPAKPLMPLLHIDTTWKFKAMYALRDAIQAAGDVQLIVHTNHEGLRAGFSPLGANAAQYTDVMKTHALLQALQIGGFDAAIGQRASFFLSKRIPSVGPQVSTARALVDLQYQNRTR